MQHSNYLNSIQLSRLDEVRGLTKLSKSSIYSAIKDETFPRPIKIGKRAVAWKLLDIQNWIDSKTLSNGVLK